MFLCRNCFRNAVGLEFVVSEKKKKEFRVINFKLNSASKIYTKDTHTHKVIRNKHILW